MARWAWLLILVWNAQGAEAPLRILFLGNSYTYYNNLPGLVQGMARRPVEARFVTMGGATLEELFTSTEAYDVLHGSRWDLVVLQEQSTLGVNTFNGDFVVNVPGAFHTWARIWDREIRATGAHTVFLNTWARKGRGEQQPHLDWAYASIARELRAGLIPVGTAFAAANGEGLYEPDGHHPSAAGSYLAACVAVEILTGDGCAGAPSEVRGVPMDNGSATLGKGEWIVRLPADAAPRLQRAALEAVDRLRTEGGYWRLARPVYGGEAPLPAGRAGVSFGGRWEGTSWFHGSKEEVALEIRERDSKCEGSWRVGAVTLAVENCTVEAGRLRFTMLPYFMAMESHEAVIDGGTLVGMGQVGSRFPYRRNTGTWTMRRAGR